MRDIITDKDDKILKNEAALTDLYEELARTKDEKKKEAIKNQITKLEQMYKSYF